MSTTVYFVCLEHDPFLMSDEVEQHISTIIVSKLQSWHNQRRQMVFMAIEHSFYGDDHYYGNAVRFFMEHSSCNMALQTQYGDWVDLGMQGIPVQGPMWEAQKSVVAPKHRLSLPSLDVFQCEYEDTWTDEVGTIPVCKLHGNNSKWDAEHGEHRPCVTVDPW